jgi:hypothetical protein
MSNLMGVKNLASNKAYKLYIKMFSTGEIIKFNAFVNSFSDDYKSSWNKQEVYGRMDPISTFKNTQRNISLDFDVPSESLEEAIENAKNADKLIQGLYPIYSSDAAWGDERGTSILSSPPLVRLKFANLIASVNYISTPDEEDEKIVETGLLGFFDGFNFKPDLEQGVHIYGDQNIVPKLFKVSLGFNVIHEHPLGTSLSPGQEEGKFYRLPRITFGKSLTFPHFYETLSAPEQEEAGDSNSEEDSSSEESTKGTSAATNDTDSAVKGANEEAVAGGK